jgi:photosystem II stability/assembly factor-like uncharacterized protein
LAHALACLVDPPTLGAIGLLLLNDHILKAAFPSWLTGKLSDLAGLYFFSFLVLAALGLLELALPPRSRSPSRAWGIAMALSALWFLGLKATPASNALAVAVLDALLGGSRRVVADPTDLIALAMLPLAWHRWRTVTVRRESWPPNGNARRMRWVRLTALALASLATVATPPPRKWDPPVSFGCVFDVAADPERGDTLYASLATYRVTEWGGPDSGEVETEQAIQTYRSQDGGRTWALYAPVGGFLWADPHTSDRLYVLNEEGLHVVEGGQARPLEVPFEAFQVEILADYSTTPDVVPSRHALAFDPATRGVLYLTDGAQILKSSDGGETWDRRAVRVPAGRLMALAVAPSAPLALYAAADDPNIGQSYVVRGDGGGYTWSQPNRFGRAPHLRALAVHPGSAEIAYVAGFGVYRTVDGGETWQDVYRANIQNIALHPGHPDIIVAAGSETVIFSDDGGDTWFSPDAQPSWDVAISPVAPHRTVLALCNEGVAVRSSMTATMATPAPSPMPPLGLAASSEPTVVYAEALAFGSDDPRTLYVLTGDPPLLSRSDDGGASWTSHPLTRALPDPPTAIIARPVSLARSVSSTYAPVPLVALGGRTTYSLTWRADRVAIESVELPEGGVVTGTRPLLAAPSHPDLLLTTAPGGILRSDDGGETWAVHVLSPTATISQPPTLTMAPGQPGNPSITVYAAVDVEHEGAGEQVVFRSEDGGITWEPRSRLTETHRLTTLAVHPAAADIVYGGGAGLYQSGDGGASWTLLDPDMKVGRLDIPPNEPRLLCAVTDAGVARSTDGGVTWTALCPIGRFNGPGEFLGAAVAPTEPYAVVLLARPTRPDVHLPSLGSCSAPDGPRYDLTRGWERFSEGLPVFVQAVED